MMTSENHLFPSKFILFFNSTVRYSTIIEFEKFFFLNNKCLEEKYKYMNFESHKCWLNRQCG